MKYQGLLYVLLLVCIGFFLDDCYQKDIQIIDGTGSLSCTLPEFTTPFSSRPSGTAVTSAEELPIDKFDEYRQGAFPPFPWTRLSMGATDLNLSLHSEDESPFVGNLVTGKGLTMTDRSVVAGQGDGIQRRFTPAPPGSEWLSFDFKTDIVQADREVLDLCGELVDSAGNGLSLTINAAGLSVAGAQGKRHLADIVVGQWYHLGANIDQDKTVTVTVTPFDKKSPQVKVPHINLPSSSQLDTLRFYNCGPHKQRGTWTVDNVLMAGQVDAPRDGWWPFDQAPLSQLRASDKKVFIYYFPMFTAGPTSEDPGLSWFSRSIMNPTLLKKPDRIDAGTEFLYCPLPRPPLEPIPDAHEARVRAMEDEVRVARRMGVDGFFLDFRAFPDSNDGGTYFNEQAFALMEAAARIDPMFKIIPAIYGPKEATDESAQEFADSDVVKRALAQPSAYRLADGRVVISSWNPEAFYPATWWQKALSAIERNGTRTAFVPQFNSVNRLTEFAPISYGMAHWGPRTPGKFDWITHMKGISSKSVYPVVLQDVRTRGSIYWESVNSELFRGLWNTAITDNADWVFINTWSDYTEQAQAPSRSIGFAVFDLNAYYTQWFKTGNQPEIKRDVLYYFYRIHHSQTTPAHGKIWKLMQPWGSRNESETSDKIELLAFLKEPGQLQIQVGDKTYELNAAAGVTSFKVPLPPGQCFTPVFSLLRNKANIVSQPGQYTVLDKIEYGNMLYHSGVISPAAER